MMWLLPLLLTVTQQISVSELFQKSELTESYWNSYKNLYSLNFDESEDAVRQQIFISNLLYIEAHNKKGLSYTLEINQFGHLSDEEFKSQYLAPSSIKASWNSRVPSSDPITPVDWRKKGIIGPVKDQKACGSCWAFSAIASIEAAHALHTGNYTTFSEQDLVDCSTVYGNHGCGGGLMDYSFNYVMKKGITSGSEYTYTAKDGQCKHDEFPVAAKISSYVDVESGNEDSLTSSIISKGPISVAIVAGLPSFRFYKEGIYEDPDCAHEHLDHGVAAVGVTDKYYIVRNSWGQEWGNKGYIYMARNKKNSCGIASMASYPLI